jgi:hypothetical protein
VVIILNIVLPSDPISLKGNVYPDYAQAVGWVIVAVPLSAIPIGAIVQIIKYRNDWVLKK